ncbi:MAG UNVERIFIED_CONTAM: hypothetical protein LOD86_02445, partial [Thermobifida fusca]
MAQGKVATKGGLWQRGGPAAATSLDARFCAAFSHIILTGFPMRDPLFRMALILGLLSAVGPFAIDMYLPALPD